MTKRARRRAPMIEVRYSSIHGYGVFARRRIRKGSAIVEYIGERISHAQADARHADNADGDNHTFLFTVDSRTVIDGGAGGNEARFINHGCEPNCESTIRDKRIFIEAIRTVRAGEELFYDYQIQRDADDTHDIDAVFACHCGAKNCRGSMLERRQAARIGERRTARRHAGKRRTGTRRTGKGRTDKRCAQRRPR